jgi:two-component system, OmpR family, phosphate regulon response regulator PhoB
LPPARSRLGPGDISYRGFLYGCPPALREDRQSEVLKGYHEIMPPKLLLVEDDLPLAQMLEYNLLVEDFAVTHVLDGEAAEQLLSQEKFDLAILDWMIPKITGIELCRRLRNQPSTRFLPIILLTARSAEEDRVRGLLTGADDYITKPFSVRELIARVRNLLRRSSPERLDDILVANEFVIDRRAHKVSRAGREIRLGPTEYRLLEFFMENQRRVLSRAQLLDNVWDQPADVDDRTVDVHVGRLRRLLTEGDQTDPIRTIRGAGYVFGWD